MTLNPSSVSSVGPGTNVWANPTNASASDDAYADMNLAFLAADNDSLDFEFDASISAGATLDGYEVDFERRYAGGAGAPITDDIVQLLSASETTVGENKSVGLQWNTSQAIQTYGGPADLWDTTLTVTQLNTFIGVRMRAGSDATGRRGLVDHVTLTIYFTEAAGGSILLPVLMQGG